MTMKLRGRRIARHAGFTLTEIAIVLGVIGLIIGAIWVAAGTVQNKNNTNSAVMEVQTVSQNILTFMQNRKFPQAAGTPITDAMITANAIPTWMRTSAVTASNPWNSTGFVVTVNAGGPAAAGTPDQFRLSLYGVPNDACTTLLFQLMSCDTAQPGCPGAVFTGGSPGGAPTQTLTPLSAANGGWQSIATLNNVQALCAANTTGNVNSVEFDFSL